MKTTVDIDDELLKMALVLTGIKNKGQLINKGLKELIEWESSRRLAKLGGTQPKLKRPDRRQK